MATSPASRAALFAAKVASEELQGVAAPGAGAYVREQRWMGANDGSHAEFATSVAAPSASFAVNASLRWNPSLFAIQAGERYRVEVLGEQRWVDGFVKADSRGYAAHYDAVSQCWVAAGVCRSYLGARTRLKTAAWFALVCGIGDYVWKLQEDALHAI